ncbi:MAG: MBL fold metallo-hydrolase [Bacteroidetes bacterium]|nr:MBL fold metallo-hydrolase [Rhodothermia bacterium]MCS7156065.1 MBL fold metallo-hydrolase [Bacteroidota bacterium]MCX7907753.1 MBL fold metallo-hydrolase [Bacteroidota bacterium]MDW8137882.1 MBL fold metallo-hydrolase [Bacteroidota bacterium]MDW8286267.1 MBL fold metallo-hydrolase [Bacteroidota bacterium]
MAEQGKTVMRIGPYEVRAVQAGWFRLDGGAMFGVVPKVLWERRTPADERNRILLGTRCLLLIGAGRVVLVDVGIGAKYSEKFADLYGIDQREHDLESGLRAHGLRPEDVTDVLLTHLHFDHVGGATRWAEPGRAVPTFPRATYYVQRSQWEAALKPNARERASFLGENFLPLLEAHQLEFLDGNVEVLPGIHTRVVNGHTRGQQLVKVSDGQHTLLYAADLLPTVHHIGLPWIMAYDMCAQTTLTEKALLLEQAAQEGWWLFFEHDPEITLCRVRRTERDFEPVDEHRELPADWPTASLPA